MTWKLVGDEYKYFPTPRRKYNIYLLGHKFVMDDLFIQEDGVTRAVREDDDGNVRLLAYYPGIGVAIEDKQAECTVEEFMLLREGLLEAVQESRKTAIEQMQKQLLEEAELAQKQQQRQEVDPSCV